MLCSYFITLLLLLYLSFMLSTVVALPIHCEYPCQPSPSLPLYGTPPPPPPSPLSPPIEPVYEAPPPPPSGPVYESPSPPSNPSCEPPPLPPPPPPTKPSCEPPPPAPQLPTSPLYGVPPPPLLPGNCQPSLQNCGYSPPNTDVYQPVDSASRLPLNCLLSLVLMLLSFLHF